MTTTRVCRDHAFERTASSACRPTKRALREVTGGRTPAGIEAPVGGATDPADAAATVPCADAANANSPLASLARPSASANKATVVARGERLLPASNAAMPEALIPARSASCSCVSAAATRHRRNISPNDSTHCSGPHPATRRNRPRRCRTAGTRSRSRSID
jgi:hypothetical protein